MKDDINLEPAIAIARSNKLEMQRMALDCTRMLQSVNSRHEDLINQGFCKRLWGRFTGQKDTVHLQNQEVFAKLQLMAFKYLERLNEENLMTLDAVVTVKNQLSYAVSDIADLRENTGAAIEDIYATIINSHKTTTAQIKQLQQAVQNAIVGLATKMKEKLSEIENRIVDLEINSKLHGWLLTFQEFDYAQYPEATRMIQIVRQYRLLKRTGWTVQDARYLKNALRRAGLDPDEPIKIRDLVQELARENYPEKHTECIHQLLYLPQVDPDKVHENVSLPALNALYVFSKNNRSIREAIERAAGRFKDIDVAEELAKQIAEILDECGIEVNAETKRHHFAMELLTGIETARAYGWKAGYTCPDDQCSSHASHLSFPIPGRCTRCGKELVIVQ